MAEGPLFFATPAELESWLEENHGSSDGIWVRIAKKHTGIPSLSWAGAVDVLLCFGWIDGRARRVDDDWYEQHLTPRRPRSMWSKINRAKAEALIAAGRMRPAGIAEVERARADGRWDAAYDGPATATVPDDLHAALQAAGLRDAFAALDGRNRYAILHRVQTARRPDTRARRITAAVEMLGRGERPYP
ncbi:MAG TPA: YdeI/OmpD-associated family protein [Miltoncostaeaceae bacterium]|nr:YdeI/OmpD-associated family protein [Miltoncostaeaceae bacterium]